MAGESSDEYEVFNQTLKDAETEIRETTTLIRKVSFLGEFIVVSFREPPSYHREELLNQIAGIITEKFGSDYVLFKQEKNDFIFRRSGR